MQGRRIANDGRRRGRRRQQQQSQTRRGVGVSREIRWALVPSSGPSTLRRFGVDSRTLERKARPSPRLEPSRMGGDRTNRRTTATDGEPRRRKRWTLPASSAAWSRSFVPSSRYLQHNLTLSCAVMGPTTVRVHSHSSSSTPPQRASSAGLLLPCHKSHAARAKLPIPCHGIDPCRLAPGR